VTFFDFTPFEGIRSKIKAQKNGLTKPFGNNFKDDLSYLTEEVGVNRRKSLG
jgi:hypothetical protein